jgi:thymidine phosphorylase
VLEDRRRVDLPQIGLLGEADPRFAATKKFSSMNAIPPARAQLRSRRVNLDTGRENVVVISRRSTALRPDLFRGFSRVDMSKLLLDNRSGRRRSITGRDHPKIAQSA